MWHVAWVTSNSKARRRLRHSTHQRPPGLNAATRNMNLMLPLAASCHFSCILNVRRNLSDCEFSSQRCHFISWFARGQCVARRRNLLCCWGSLLPWWARPPLMKRLAVNTPHRLLLHPPSNIWTMRTGFGSVVARPFWSEQGLNIIVSLIPLFWLPQPTFESPSHFYILTSMNLPCRSM